jgi:hypothetical protein
MDKAKGAEGREEERKRKARRPKSEATKWY